MLALRMLKCYSSDVHLEIDILSAHLLSLFTVYMHKNCFQWVERVRALAVERRGARTRRLCRGRAGRGRGRWWG